MRNNKIFANIPSVVKYLLLINGGMLLITYLSNATLQIELTQYLGLHYFESERFQPYQIVTHMFMHANFFHLLFNMYALFLFGKILETVWGSKKFLIYYLVTGFGAAALHTAYNWYEMSTFLGYINEFLDSPTADSFALLTEKYSGYFNQAAVADLMNQWSMDPNNKDIAKSVIPGIQSVVQQQMNIPTVGASGAVFGILLAFGMLFPNQPLQLLFIPIPIKAKYFVMGYGAIELFSGIANNPGDNVAHFAHLGGMLFGFILIKMWGKNNMYKKN